MKPADVQARPVAGSQPDAALRGEVPAASNAQWDEDLEQQRAPLTHQEAASLFGEAALRTPRITPFRVVAMQLAVTVLGMVVWALIRGMSGGAFEAAMISALIGGACVVVPNAVFALRLALAAGRPTVGGLIFGEALKIVITLAMLLAAGLLYGPMDWAAMLVTFMLALKMLWIALALR